MSGLEVLHGVAEFRAACDGVRARGGRVGLVPTMGALHEGHLELIREAGRRASEVAVTIFVNPTQFGPKEDFAKYPRDLAGDVDKCRGAGARLVFAPERAAMYVEGELTRVCVSRMTEPLCGASRPVHFEGVTTIVTKLFAVTGPCVAVFGRKDYQQLAVIRRMTEDLMLPVEIVAHPTVREPDGLAMSSRNRFLSPDERSRALAIPRALASAVRAFDAGERSVAVLLRTVERQLAGAELRLDYANLADADRIDLFDDAAKLPARALLAIAVFAGATRLIDNVVLGEDPAPVAS